MTRRITGSYNHGISAVRPDVYRIFWAVDYRNIGRPGHVTRTTTHVVDRDGAERFAAKWGVAIPSVYEREELAMGVS